MAGEDTFSAPLSRGDEQAAFEAGCPALVLIYVTLPDVALARATARHLVTICFRDHHPPQRIRPVRLQNQVLAQTRQPRFQAPWPPPDATLRPLPSPATGLPRLPKPLFRPAMPTAPVD